MKRLFHTWSAKDHNRTTYRKKPNLISLGDEKMAFEKMVFEMNETATTGEDDNVRVDFEESSAYPVQNFGSVTPRG